MGKILKISLLNKNKVYKKFLYYFYQNIDIEKALSSIIKRNK